MRYFSSNLTHVIHVGGLEDYRIETKAGIENLGLLADQLATVFSSRGIEVYRELILALEHGKIGDSGYFAVTQWSPAMASALWSVARVVFDTYKFGESRDLGRSQAIVADLNLGMVALIIVKIDYEGCLTDAEISTRAF